MNRLRPGHHRTLLAWTVSVALTAAFTATACRATTAPAIDLDKARAEGRLLQRPPVHALVWTQQGLKGDAPFVWEGDRADASIVEARVVLVTAPRLVVDVLDPAQRRTPFVIDTGTTSTFLSTASPLAESALVWEASHVASGRSGPGRMAVVPEVRIGGLIGRDVEVALFPAPHSLANPRNLIGQDLLRGLLLRHVRGRWSLIRRTPEAVAADPPAFVVPLLAPGLPMVRVRDPQGELRFALIDTGAPMAIPTARTPKGTWHLEGFRNAIPIASAAGTTDASPHFRVGEWPISLLIGLDSLAAADWVLDLEAGEWRFLGGVARGR